MAAGPQAPLRHGDILQQLKDQGITNLDDLVRKIIEKNPAHLTTAESAAQISPNVVWWGHNYVVWIRPE